MKSSCKKMKDEKIKRPERKNLMEITCAQQPSFEKRKKKEMRYNHKNLSLCVHAHVRPNRYTKEKLDYNEIKALQPLL